MSKTKKILIAVHGIGDQFGYQTVQSVAHRFCEHRGVPAAIPLGSFYSSLHKPPMGAAGFFASVSPAIPDLPDIGFAEVYWADVSRVPAKEGYVLEESKKWAKTLVERIACPCVDPAHKHEHIDLARLKSVLEEMIEAIIVLERLFFLADKAGLFKFDLKKVLTDYLGDVQIFTEFRQYREEILNQFGEVMKRISASAGFENAEIYIVAHSEGTVIAFLGLLKAMSSPANPYKLDWTSKVRGFMTIGSPIDKHLLIWPQLWGDLKPRQLKPEGPKIMWRNYYDFGDPVGFRLDKARGWLKEKEHDWTPYFDFEEANDSSVKRLLRRVEQAQVSIVQHLPRRFRTVVPPLQKIAEEGQQLANPAHHDIGFSRYYLPGKAHVDYWQDEHVFGHFFTTVMCEPPLGAKSEKRKAEFADPPTNKKLPIITTAVAPYSLSAVLLLLGCYFLYKAIEHALGVDETFLNILKITGAATFFLGGISVAVRIPHLTRVSKWRVIAAVVLVLFTAIAALLMQTVQKPVIFIFNLSPYLADMQIPNFVLAPLIAAVVVLLVCGLTYLLNKFCTKCSKSGVKPLLFLGGILVVLWITISLYFAPRTGTGSMPVWPLFLAGAGFLYLWWLSILLFDLTFVWRRYIRESVALDCLCELRAKTGGTNSATVTPTPEAVQPAVAD